MLGLLGYWVIGCRLRDAGCKMQDAGCRMSDSEFCISHLAFRIC
ncbi:MAG: hypothetical protein WCO02_05065 [Bacteroidota bacterium]